MMASRASGWLPGRGAAGVLTAITSTAGVASCARRWGMTLGAASKTCIQNAPEGART
jgi:hypothetical protein